MLYLGSKAYLILAWGRHGLTPTIPFNKHEINEINEDHQGAFAASADSPLCAGVSAAELLLSSRKAKGGVSFPGGLTGGVSWHETSFSASWPAARDGGGGQGEACERGPHKESLREDPSPEVKGILSHRLSLPGGGNHTQPQGRRHPEEAALARPLSAASLVVYWEALLGRVDSSQGASVKGGVWVGNSAGNSDAVGNSDVGSSQGGHARPLEPLANVLASGSNVLGNARSLEPLGAHARPLLPDHARPLPSCEDRPASEERTGPPRDPRETLEPLTKTLELEPLAKTPREPLAKTLLEPFVATQRSFSILGLQLQEEHGITIGP
ncbi:hypothetical protein T484DRAFT_1826436 [Baffinella frigidus]|nr:hypothetical protein T484DRAFT_1826436 [Cryptophyta sp. CCMP2293]